jgi:probable addiction module antidote protein
MTRSVSYNKRLLKHLKNSDEAAAYLNAVLAEGDSKLFLKALGKVAEAKGGVGQLSSKTKVSRVGLYKVFSEKGNPEFKTIEGILEAFKLRFLIAPQKAGAR